MENTKLKITVIISCLLNVPQAFAGVRTAPRTDSVISIRGTLTPTLKFSFGETVYIAANLLDPSCLLRVPDGSFKLVSESRPVNPTVSNGAFQINLSMNHFNGSDVCQFRFAFIKLWFEYRRGRDPQPKSTFLFLAPRGSQYEGKKLLDAEFISQVQCATNADDPNPETDLRCLFAFSGSRDSSAGATIPSKGLTIDGLQVVLAVP